MTLAYPINLVDGVKTGQSDPFVRTDSIQLVYRDILDGGFCYVWEVTALAGATVAKHPAVAKANDGIPPAQQKPSLITVNISGRKIVEEIDDQDNVIATTENHPGNRYGANRNAQAQWLRATYPEDTMYYCFGMKDHDIVSHTPGARNAGQDLIVPDAGVSFLWEGQVTFDGQTYDAPYVFYGTSPPGEIPECVTDCSFERLVLSRRPGT